MAKLINWKSNWLNGNFQLFVDGIQKGAINFETWRSDAQSIFEDQQYIFKNDGHWQSKTNVIDRETNETVAVIIYDSWKSKAVINMKNGEQYEWKSTNFWKTEFTVSNDKDTNMLYSSSNHSGTISSNTDNNLLIVTGLFIKAIYNKRMAVLVASFMPLLIVTISRHH